MYERELALINDATKKQIEGLQAENDALKLM